MDFSGANLAGFGVLDIRRFIGDAIPLMGRANRRLARREESV